jgi:ABC-type amino acid transport substrate-binding protein
MDFSSQDTTLESIFLFIGAFVLVLLPLIARMYALTLQNRIIINEMRNRYFHLTGKPFKEKEKELRLGQIIGLRFASDEELLDLIDRAIAEKLTSKEIKQQIKNWRGDYLRV